MESIRNPVVYAALGDSMSIDDFAGWAGRDLTARDPPPG
jgi:hypothetical protein